ncbi:MAG: OB-fold protein [Aurantibacter sp.]
MKGKKSLVLVFLMVIILGLALAIYYYNKPHVDVKQSEAAYVLTAHNLISAYMQNETETDQKYSEHVLQVKGAIFEISTLKGNAVITLKDENLESSIICHMMPEENMSVLRKLQKGQDIEIKGICTGYLLDVIMVRCTLVK